MRNTTLQQILKEVQEEYKVQQNIFNNDKGLCEMIAYHYGDDCCYLNDIAFSVINTFLPEKKLEYEGKFIVLNDYIDDYVNNNCDDIDLEDSYNTVFYLARCGAKEYYSNLFYLNKNIIVYNAKILFTLNILNVEEYKNRDFSSTTLKELLDILEDFTIDENFGEKIIEILNK